MNILITGGAGYIGAVLTPALLKEGHVVTVIDNFMYNQASLLDCCYHHNLRIIRGDARDKDLISKELRNVDVIIPLACLTGAPLCNKEPIGAKTTNYDAIKMILDLRDSSQIIIFPTTNSGYGLGQNGLFCTEKTPLNPISLYGRLKVDAEKILLDSGNCITLRLATVFGISPRMRLDLLVNDFTYRAVTDHFIILFEAHFKRNYIHVRDVAKAFIHCLNNYECMKNEPYNVGLSDANLSKRELCEEIKKVVPNFTIVESDTGKDPDQRNYIVSNEKIEKSGFEPDVPITMGIQELVKGYQVIRRKSFANV
jgi:nucleoside-diphosphate-sugar epimerase